MQVKKSYLFRFLKKSYLYLKKFKRHVFYTIKNMGAPSSLLLIQKEFIKEKTQSKSHSKIAIFFNLEDIRKSSITDFSVKTFCLLPDKYHIFATLSTTAITNHALNEAENLSGIPIEKLRIFHADDYKKMDAEIQYEANIFILGDSLFNLEAFEAAIRWRTHSKRNYLYFHDGLYTNLLYAWTSKHKHDWQKFIKKYYPAFSEKTGLTTENLLNENIRMIKPVIELTDISNIIVNADNCIPIINNEINGQDLRFIKAWLPIPDYRSVKPYSYKMGNDFIVAHFGIPNSFKHVDILIKAVSLLKKKHAIKLLLAGYGVKKYVNALPPADQSFIITEDSPNESRLLSLMKGADITVQMRWPILGQASGVVSEMLGLGLKCITTSGFMNESFKDYIVELPAHVTPELLAEAILKYKDNMVIPPETHARLLEQSSCTASANFIFNKTTETQRHTETL